MASYHPADNSLASALRSPIDRILGETSRASLTAVQSGWLHEHLGLTPHFTSLLGAQSGLSTIDVTASFREMLRDVGISRPPIDVVGLSTIGLAAQTALRGSVGSPLNAAFRGQAPNLSGIATTQVLAAVAGIGNPAGDAAISAARGLLTQQHRFAGDQMWQVLSAQRSLTSIATRAALPPAFDALHGPLNRYTATQDVITDALTRLDNPRLLRGLTAPAGARYDTFLQRIPTRPSPRRIDLARYGGDTQSSLIAVEALLDPTLTDTDAAELGEELTDTTLDPAREVVEQRRATLLGRLRDLAPVSADHLLGAWEALTQPRHAATSTVSNHVVELIDQTLRALAPHDDVLAWLMTQPRRHGMVHDGRPTRPARVRYVMRNRPRLDTAVIDEQARAISRLTKDVQSKKHGDAAQLQVLTGYLIAVENAFTVILFQFD